MRLVGTRHKLRMPRNTLSQATSQRVNACRFDLAGFAEPFSRDD